MKKSKSGISKNLASMTIVPLILLSIIITVFEIIQISASMAIEVENELRNLAMATVSTLDIMYPGDYSKYASDDKILIVKGEYYLNQKYDFIDSLKESTGVDFSIFYDDMRIITTICDSDGNRLIGTLANSQIVSDVINSNSSHFYSDVNINNIKYYCYYAPLHNSDGKVVGMVAAVTPAKRVLILIAKAAFPCLIVAFFVIIAAFFWANMYSKKFIQPIDELNISLSDVAKGKLSNTVPPSLLARKDEFGSMAHAIVDMQSSLRALVERDMLTGLNNRRFGQEKLVKLLEKYNNSKKHFSIALGDIDFFKKFNDTYGHDCGDLVLRDVSRLMQDHVKDHGTCIRWGGEEFLIIFSNGNYDRHKLLMSELLEKIESHSLSYIDQELHVTMTFGLVDVYECDNIDLAIKEVDNLLYYGKENGRNRLVTSEETS